MVKGRRGKDGEEGGERRGKEGCMVKGRRGKDGEREVREGW
jgi:hypothetical protein